MKEREEGGMWFAVSTHCNDSSDGDKCDGDSCFTEKMLFYREKRVHLETCTTAVQPAGQVMSGLLIIIYNDHITF